MTTILDDQELFSQLDDQELFSQKIYWLNQLSRELPETNFIVDSSRPSVYTGKNQSHYFELPDYLSQEIIKLAKGSDFLLYLMLLSAFKLLLKRYLRTSDIIVGVPVYKKINGVNLDYLDDSKLIPLQTKLHNEMTFKNVLMQVKDNLIEAYSHQDYCFDELIGLLNLPEAENRCSLFDIVILLENIHNKNDILKVNNDITISFISENNKICGSINYKEAIFKNENIKSITNYYTNIIESIVNNIDIQVSDIVVLNDFDRQKIIQEFNYNIKEYPVDKTINQLFEQQVYKTPNNIAVVDGKTKLTYQELNEKANQLAVMLRQLGLSKGEFVGIFKDRDINFLIAILAIYKAGGAYVPIDSTYPSNRIEYMLSNSEVQFLLTDTSLFTVLTDLIDNCSQLKSIICLDGVISENIQLNHNQELTIYDQLSFINLPKDNLEPINDASDSAYMLYTSGSTGLPKGAIVRHDGAVNHIYAQFDELELTEEFCFLQSAPSSTDISVWQFLAPLLIGGRTVIVDIETVAIPEKLFKVLLDEEITVVELVPVLFGGLLEYASALPNKERELPSLKWMMVVGEPASVNSVNKWLQVYPKIKIVNAYGPTEAADDITQFIIDKPLPENQRTIPIGKPLANLNLYILDEQMKLLPIGAPGEICVSGIGVGAGYWKNEEKTQLSFVPNPFTDITDMRKSLPQNRGDLIYKTGDLGRWLPDGNIEFLGRIDHQVKIRGFRVELGEIETFLLQHEAVRETVVVVREENPDDKRLVAYVVPKSEFFQDGSNSSIVEQLRDSLKEKLPVHMVPSAIVLLEALPLAPSGKIDRGALPVPSFKNESDLGFVAPRTPTEEILADIWSQVLKQEHIGIHDNFFDLGGHSLLATQLISRIREAFSIEIPLRELFSSPTVAQLGQTLSQLQTSNDNQPSLITIPAIIPTPEEKSQPFPLTDIQQAYWLGRNQNFELSNIATHIYFEIDFLNLNLPQLNQAWQKLIEYHDMLRVVILPSGEQKILEKVPTYSIEALDLRSCSQSEISSELETIREQMSHEVLPAEQWPLFKIRATILDEERTRLHLSFDALFGDAWSMALLEEQWQQLYENPQTLLTPLEISFRDYVLAELSLKDTPKYQQAQEYWFNRNLPPAPELPFALHPSSISKPTFKRHSARLEAQQWQQLKQWAARANLTPSAVLLAAYADILNYWSKSPNFTIDLTLFNRLPLHRQVNQLVGDFTSVTLLEVDHSIVSSFTARSQRLQQQLWQDLDHNYVSGVEVLRELRRVRGNTQPMGVVFTSTLGLNSLTEDTSSSKSNSLTEDTSSSKSNQLRGEEVYGITQTSQVWLDHEVSEEGGALVFHWDVVEELFPAGLIKDMFASYCNWLEQLANTEEAWSETHPQLLPPKQLSSIVTVNDTGTSVVEETLHGLFYKQVAARSVYPAVITPNKTLTYEQLHEKASNLAQRLRQLGATPNTLVAIIMEKGWEQIVAVLGILISGAAYLPISPEFPQERQQYLLEQGKVNLVLTQPQLEQNLSLPSDIECLVVTEEELQTAPCNQLESIQTPDDLAYVIYTSGSTGKPKGVVIDHKGAVNTILDINKRFGVGINDRVLALSALEFDLSVYDIFGILAAGGAIVMPEPAPSKRKDPAHWLELINANQVTIWNTVPALMQMLVEHLSARSDKQAGDLRLALLSGDWLPVELPEKVKSFYSNIKVISLGGATEASIWSIFYPIEKVESNWKSIPYGKPLENQRFYVLNQLMQPTPTWVLGELYIGGVGLAQGYWQDQNKTDASFIIHPQTNERLYKTGDLGRYLPDGNIEFLGREDFQVKVNGYRIELGEIEALLQQHPSVKEVVVAAIGELRENQQLVGYIVPHSEIAASNHQQLEAYEPNQLPDVLLDIEKIEFKLKQSGLRQTRVDDAIVKLPEFSFDEVLKEAYLQRQSYRHFQNEFISLEQFSQFLGCLRQMQLDGSPLPKYRYPSAGSLYPVQTYLYVKPHCIEGLTGGFYYYHPADHNLVLLNPESAIASSIYGDNQLIFEQSAFSVFLIGQLDAITPMYGELAKDFCLLEAGYIGQLLMNHAPEYDIGLCPIGYLEFAELRELFILESSQILLHSFIGGKIEHTQTQQWIQPQPIQQPKTITEELRTLLQQKLPEYMIPNTLLLLEELPLTPNGKVDRKALPIPDQVRPKLEAVYIAPQTEVEKTIANICQEVLRIEEIGIHDNFFELGGHSLLLVQIHNKLQNIFQQLSLVDIFQYPTINYLAKYLTQSQYKGQSVQENTRQNKTRTASINRRKQARQSYRTEKQK